LEDLVDSPCKDTDEMSASPETLITLITVQDELNAAGIKTLKRSQIAAAVLLKERIRCVDLARLMQVSKQNCMVTVKLMEKDRLLRVESIKETDGRKTAWVMPVPYLKDVFAGIEKKLLERLPRPI